MKLDGNEIYLKLVEISDASALLSLEVRNKDFFRLYTTPRKANFFTLDGQLKRIEELTQLKELDQYYFYGMYLKDTEELIGIVHLSEVARGPFQSCWLGYYLDKVHNGKGYMTEAIRLVVNYAFKVLNLHRIEAGVMPHNIGSIKVLEKVGFHKEGIARKNVLINENWEDHQTLAIVNAEWKVDLK